MKKDALLKKLNLNSAQLEEIKKAVATAEEKTTGEIALAVVPQSNSYAFVELTVAFCVAFVSFFVLFLFSASIWQFMEQVFWCPAPWLLIGVIGFAVIVIVLFTYLLLNIPIIDRLIIPNKLKEKRVYIRALQHFVESGVYRTAEHTGILIFVSLLEKKIFVIADAGINEKVEDGQWAKINAIIGDGLKSKNSAKAFINATEECGRILAEHFPNKKQNPNELSDGLVVLEK